MTQQLEMSVLDYIIRVNDCVSFYLMTCFYMDSYFGFFSWSFLAIENGAWKQWNNNYYYDNGDVS